MEPMNKTVLAAFLALGLSVFGFGTAAHAQSNKLVLGQQSTQNKNLPVPQALVPGPIERVHTTLEDNQTWKSSTALDDGGYMVLWQTTNALATQGHYLQRFDEDGKKVGGEILLPDIIIKLSYGTITPLTDGSLVIAYVGSRNAQGELVYPSEVESGVFIQKFDARGVQILRETAVVRTRGPGTVYGGGAPVALSNGDFVLRWSSNSLQASAQQAVSSVQRFNSEGYPSGSPIVLPTFDPRVGPIEYGVQAAHDGGFLLGKLITDQTPYIGACYGAMSRSTATSFIHYDQHMVPRQILAPTHCASVLALADGNFMSYAINEKVYYAQLIDANGTLVGPQKTIASRAESRSPRLHDLQGVKALSDGSFIVNWYPENYVLTSQRYSSKGDPIGGSFELNKLLSEDILGLTNGDALLIGISNQPGQVGVDLYMQRLVNMDQMNDPQKNWKRKQCQAQSKAMKGQERKAFVDRCLAD
jgi:hypothetical protein